MCNQKKFRNFRAFQSHPSSSASKAAADTDLRIESRRRGRTLRYLSSSSSIQLSAERQIVCGSRWICTVVDAIRGRFDGGSVAGWTATISGGSVTSSSATTTGAFGDDE